MRKVLSVFLVLAMLFTTFAFAAPAPATVVETESAQEFAGETVEETATTEVESVSDDSASLQAATRPGLNLFTGTTNALDFEDGNNTTLLTHGNFPTFGVVDNNILDWNDSPKAEQPTGNTSTKVLAAKCAEAISPYQSFYIANTFEAGRKYEISFDEYGNTYEAKKDGEKRRFQEIAGWLINFKGSNSHITLADAKTENVENNKWVSRKYTEAANSAGLSNVQVQMKVGTDTSPREYYSFGYLYFDNFAIYPYYRINYYGADGKVATSEQILRDGEGNFVTSYTVKTDNLPEWNIDDGTTRTCIGWGTSPTATETVTNVTLANADVNLYPVWETTEFITGEKIIKVTEGTSTTLTAAEPVTWEYTVGNTKATVAPVEGAEDTQLTVTSTGYNGEVTVTATLKSDPTKAYNATVVIAGIASWTPGINYLTGTTGVYTFENLTNAQVKYTFGLNDTNVILAANPVPDTNNTSAMVVKIGGGYAAVWQANELTTPIEAARPLLINYDYVGTTNNHWIMKNGSGADDIGYDISGSHGSTGTWRHVSLAKTLNQNNNSDVRKLGFEGSFGSTSNTLSFDNVSIVPFYKVTYMGEDNETPVSVDYVLTDSSNNVLTTFAPSEEIIAANGVAGYSLTPGGEIAAAVPLNNEDITLYPVSGDYVIFSDGFNTYSSSLDEYVDGDFTFPTMAEMGLNATNFRVWLDAEGNKYTDGATITEDQLVNLVNTTLTAYYQDATVSAMGFSYEGTEKTNAGANKFASSEVTMDEGRTVFHAHQDKGTWSGTKWFEDARITHKQTFNSTEYNIFQISVKGENGVNVTPSTTVAADIKAENLVPKESAPMIIYYYTSPTNFYDGGEHRVGGWNINWETNGNYTVSEVDMSKAENYVSNAPWAPNADSQIFGFAIDAFRVNYQGDVYLDYVRVYRDGIFTVNYDSNFPSDADLTGAENVAADEGRGAGVGYMLKGQYPKLNDAKYMFLGWATTRDAKTAVESIDLTGDTTVYGVWAESKPTTSNVASIRTHYPTGIRFMASVTDDQKLVADEYGFVVGRKVTLEAAGLTNDNLALDCGVAVVSGAAYKKADGVDKVYTYDDENGITFFTGVVTGIPAGMENDVIVARPYTKINGQYFYGATIEKSIYEVAKAVKDAGYTGLDAYGIAAIDAIVNAVEG